MANLAKAAVTTHEGHALVSTSGTGIGLRRLTLALTGQGDGTDLILASVLGFKRLLSVTPAVRVNGATGYFCGINTGTNNGNASGINADDVVLLFKNGADTPTTLTGFSVDVVVVGIT